MRLLDEKVMVIGKLKIAGGMDVLSTQFISVIVLILFTGITMITGFICIDITNCFKKAPSQKFSSFCIKIESPVAT
jgi:hypothetical protein